jgi:predicted TIM-barrel fold metal-dependent hydrolase
MAGDIAWAIDMLGVDRVLYGSDTLDHIPVELAKYRQGLDVPEDALARLLGGNAARVFKLPL